MGKLRAHLLTIIKRPALYIVISIVFIAIMYLDVNKKGMPVKRWVVLAGLLGPVAWYLFNVHYRRALLRTVGANACVWRP
ncbi:hypothetical protein C7Y70_07040 [Pseudoalteromonas sp. KS88]|nr:hypothetical protein [Pseudoalteromonas sp.]TGE84339.1 hypothetical protein C7Y70_07040 [Pseudoalteromonas sp. KS88]